MAGASHDEFDHDNSCTNYLCYGNAEKKHATHIVRYGHGLLRVDKNNFKICICGSCCTGCLFAENVERAGIFQQALQKANGDKMLEHAYLREYGKY